MEISVESTITFVGSDWSKTRPVTWHITYPGSAIHAIRGEDYPSLAAIWENDEDDTAFAEGDA